MVRLLMAINTFFIGYLLIYTFIFFSSTLYSIITMEERRKKRELALYMAHEAQIDETPISIVVPAYDEEKTIVACVESLIKLDYPLYEVIIVNDGSKDLTKEEVLQHFELLPVQRPIRKQLETQPIESIYEGYGKVAITLVNKQNGGKADAINTGINVAKYPLFICLDADSILKQDSLKEIAAPFKEDERVVAVGGNIKVANNKVIHKGRIVGKKKMHNLWVRYQMIEYARVFMLTRVWLNALNANLIVSGAFGVFRKQAVIDVGGYTSHCIGEDMELVMKLHAYYRGNKLPYKIEYVPTAVCWTQVPNRLKDIRNQRKRWHYGLMESLSKHRYMFLKVQYGTVGSMAYLYYGIFELASCVIEMVGVFNVIALMLYGILRLDVFLWLIFFYIIYNYLISCASYVIECDIEEQSIQFKDFLVMFGIGIIESILIKQLFTLYRLGAVWNYAKGKQQWNKAKRQEV